MKLLDTKLGRISIVLALLCLPSLAWSMVYRMPKLVLDEAATRSGAPVGKFVSCRHMSQL